MKLEVHKIPQKRKKGSYSWYLESDKNCEWIACYSDPHKQFEIARFYTSGVSCGLFEGIELADHLIGYMHDKFD